MVHSVDFNQLLFEFIDITKHCLINSLMHDTLNCAT